jgi:formylglycine-generating enzyme required for sulfatase activity
MDEAQVDGDPTLIATSRASANQLVNELLAHPDRYNDLVKATRPMMSLLRQDLEALFRDPNGSEAARSMAANILANHAHAGQDVDALVRLLVDATPRQFPIILAALTRSKTAAITSLRRVLEPPRTPGASDHDRNHVASQQANAAIALCQFGETAQAWSLLEHRPDPLVRTYLIDRMAKLGVEPGTLLDRLGLETDESVRIALLLILGGIPADQRSNSWFPRAMSQIGYIYEVEASPGVHSAAEWVQRQWGLQRPAFGSPEPKSPVNKHWYLTKNGHTMALIPAATSFRMGRSETEPVRDKDEAPHECRIPRRYYMSTHEVSATQYLQFRRDVSTATFHDSIPDRFPNDYSSDPNGPMNIVFWLDAIAYCRWLSEREGIPEDQMCYPKLDQIKFGMTPNPDYLSRIGYRLPTEAEWEYAARGGASTSRFFGDDDAMLPRYGWFVMNSGGTLHLSGLLLPNDYGLFDVLGNLKEWCYDAYEIQLHGGIDQERMAPIDGKQQRVARGGSYSDGPNVLRVANRYFNEPTQAMFAMGFRVARTAPKPSSR